MEKTGHILVAEDDPTDAFFFERAFKRAGIPVKLQFVKDGQAVVDYLEKGTRAGARKEPLPDLVLLDLTMPRLTGFEVLEWIRKQRRLKTLMVVIFSSSNEPKDMKRAYELGAHSYLVKPHSISGLMALVGEFKKAWAGGNVEKVKAPKERND